MFKRIKTGIYGLDELMGGGYRPNSVNSIIGTTGVGKTVFGMQYAVYGLNRGENAVYVSIEMTEEELISECEQLGWHEIREHVERGNLSVFQVYAEDTVFLTRDLLGMIESGCKEGDNNRIVIDSFTPFVLRSDSRRRKGVAEFFKRLRNLGTTVITLEEPFLESSSFEDAIIPILLSDSVIRLQNVGYGELFSRTLRIVKHRGSNHGEGLYPYYIEKGLGMVVEASKSELQQVKPKTEFGKEFERVIKEIRGKAPAELKEILVQKLRECSTAWTRSEPPTNTLNLFLKTELDKYD